MGHFNQEKERKIIGFLMDNQTMPHSQASKTLTELGFKCSTQHVYLLRKNRPIPFDVKPITLQDRVKELAKNGVALTSEFVMAELGVNRKYATELIRRVNGRDRKRKEVKPAPTFIRTKVGNVTRVQWR